MTFDSRLLRHFATVVAEGSLGRAAEALACTQPALSRAIQRLESQLGVTLFERRTTGMVLTPFGQALLPYANLLNAECQHAVAEIAALQGLHRGWVRVGAVAGAAVSLIPEAVERLLRQWPGIQVAIVEGVVDRLCAALTGHDIDLVIAGSVPESDEIENIFQSRRGDISKVVARPGHPVHNIGEPSLERLQSWQWVMPPVGTAPRTHFDAVFKQHGLAPVISVETRSVEIMRSLVAGTDLLAWLPEPLVESDCASGRVASVLVPDLRQERIFSIYRRTRGFLSPPTVKFLDELKSVMASSGCNTRTRR